MQTDHEIKPVAKATPDFSTPKKTRLLRPSQSAGLYPVEHALHLLKVKHSKNKQEPKTAATQVWQSITRDESLGLVMSMGSRLQAVTGYKRFPAGLGC